MPVKLFSLDGGKLWFTKPGDVKAFKRRRLAILREGAGQYLRSKGDEYIACGEADYWNA